MSAILEIEGLRKQYGENVVLDGVSFRMQEGERICILGPSGCGKSTLLSLAAGTLRADGGSIRMDGVTVEGGKSAVPPERRPVNMVFQDYALWPHMTVRENIEYGMRHRKVPRADRDARLQRLTGLLRLGGLMNRLPAQLSGGQQQRTGIARALATEPRVLLLDEPLSNLDVKLRMEMRHELALLLRSLATTALHVTHDAMEAFALADRILVLREGRVEQLAAPQELFERPATPWVAELMGYHNRLRAQLEGPPDGDTAHLCAGDQPLAGIHRPLHDATIPPGEALVMLHHDEVRLMPHAHTEGTAEGTVRPGDNVLRARVSNVIYEGARWRIGLETPDGQQLQALHPGPLEPGAEVLALFSPRSTLAFAPDAAS